MYKELVSVLKHCAGEEEEAPCSACGLMEDENCISALMMKAAEAIADLCGKYFASEADNINLTGWLAEEHAKHLWIPVKERLPEINCRVLVAEKPYCKNTVSWLETACFSPNLEIVDHFDFEGENRPGFYEYDSEAGYYEITNVTHWMPLPKPPKPEDDD